MPSSRNKFKRENLLQKHNLQIFSKENERAASSCSAARICLHTQNHFPLSSRKLTKKVRIQLLLLFTIYTNKKSYKKFNQYL